MGIKISVCGKGGSGKSTLVGLLANSAQTRGLTTLVVDSDESNSGLFRMLGLDKPPTPLMALVGGKQGIKEKMDQPALLSEAELTLEQIPYPYVNQKNGLRLLSIGKIHQALEGCACPMGVLSREFLKKLRLGENEIAIVDMEAGIEHFGRGIDNSIDAVLVVVEPSFESIALAEKIKDLAAGINKQLWAVLNKIGSETLAAEIRAKLKRNGMETIGAISYDASVFLSGIKGDTLPQGRAARQAGEILDALLPVKPWMEHGISMCLSTVYIQSEDRRIKIMQDVAQMESNQEGYLLIGLLGDQKLVKGVIRKIDFVDDNIVILEPEK